jgi:ABC-type Fe3+/spermidine/putrescine transport system ATPase subunit
LIVFEHVCKTYPGGTDAVCDLSMEIAKGETLVLFGANGSGKPFNIDCADLPMAP